MTAPVVLFAETLVKYWTLDVDYLPSYHLHEVTSCNIFEPELQAISLYITNFVRLFQETLVKYWTLDVDYLPSSHLHEVTRCKIFKPELQATSFV